MHKVAFGAVAASAVIAAAFAVGAQELDVPGNVQAGHELAVKACASCHRVSGRRFAPHIAGRPPDFVTIANMASITPTSLYVFLHTPHPTMPNLILSKKESTDVIAYILSLRKQKRD